MGSHTASERRSPRGSWAADRSPRGYRWCRHSTAAIGGSIRFVAGVLIPFEVAKHVTTWTQQHADLDRPQPQLHPTGRWAAGLRYRPGRVELGQRYAVTSTGLDSTGTDTLAAVAVVP